MRCCKEHVSDMLISVRCSSSPFKSQERVLSSVFQVIRKTDGAGVFTRESNCNVSVMQATQTRELSWSSRANEWAKRVDFRRLHRMSSKFPGFEQDIHLNRDTLFRQAV